MHVTQLDRNWNGDRLQGSICNFSYLGEVWCNTRDSKGCLVQSTSLSYKGNRQQRENSFSRGKKKGEIFSNFSNSNAIDVSLYKFKFQTYCFFLEHMHALSHICSNIRLPQISAKRLFKKNEHWPLFVCSASRSLGIGLCFKV